MRLERVLAGARPSSLRRRRLSVTTTAQRNAPGGMCAQFYRLVLPGSSPPRACHPSPAQDPRLRGRHKRLERSLVPWYDLTAREVAEYPLLFRLGVPGSPTCRESESLESESL